MAATSQNSINKTVGASISGVTNTLTITNGSNTASSAAQMLITVGGTTSGNPWIQWTVGSTESFALGMRNSDSQKLYLNYNNSASVSPTTGTNMLIFDHTTPGMFLAASTYLVFNTGGSAVGTVANNGLNIFSSGTFTPTVSGAGTAGTSTYSTQAGYYVRIGDRVYLDYFVALTAQTGSGAIQMQGLPFTSANIVLNSSGSGRPGGTVVDWQTRTCEISLGFPNDTQVRWHGSANGQATAYCLMGNGTMNHRFCLTYKV